jgi:hypothetical protein
MLRKSKDFYASVFLLVFSIIMYIASYSIKMLTVSKIGAEFMPRIVAVAVFILSIILLINSIKEMKRPKQEIESLEDEDEQEDANKKVSPLSVIITIGLMIGYVTLLKPVGFLIMTAVYLFLQMYVLADKAERRVPLFLGVSVISSVAVYYCFKSIFHLMLPTGILG